MTRLQIPSLSNIVGPGIAALIAARPKSLPLVNYGQGVYSHIMAGLEAQAALAIRRLADGAYNGRLSLASGQALRDLVASEYDSVLGTAPTRARGTITLTRSVGSYPAGVIPNRTRFTREATTGVPVPLPGAAFSSLDSVNVPAGVTSVRIPAEAVADGPGGNYPQTGDLLPPLTIGATLFDTHFVAEAYEFAGGAGRATDEDLRRYARAYAIGQYAPNRSALLAAALAANGVRHVIVADNTSTGVGEVYIADESWASGFDWAARVQQSIYDSGFVGFGLKVRVYPTTNKVVSAALTVRLRSANSLADTSDLDAVVKRKLRAYFDDRKDWNVWSLPAIRGVISRADKRILRCTSAAILDAAGTPVPAPAANTFVHYYLANNGVTTTYQGPV